MENLNINTLSNKKVIARTFLKGNKFLYWISKKLYNFYNKRKEKYEEKMDKYNNKTFLILDFIFINSYTILIKFKIEETGNNYQIVLTHPEAYKDLYKNYISNKSLPSFIKLGAVVKGNYKKAIKIK